MKQEFSAISNCTVSPFLQKVANDEKKTTWDAYNISCVCVKAWRNAQVPEHHKTSTTQNNVRLVTSVLESLRKINLLFTKTNSCLYPIRKRERKKRSFSFIFTIRFDPPAMETRTSPNLSTLHRFVGKKTFLWSSYCLYFIWILCCFPPSHLSSSTLSSFPAGIKRT